MKRISGILFLFVLVLMACQNKPNTQPSVEIIGQKVSVDGGLYTDVNATTLQAMLAKKDFTFVNVHIPFEGNINGTDVSIAYDQISQNLDKLPADKSAKIVLYCRSGRMSAIAAKTLVGLGYTNVWNLAGGMSAWEQAGLKIDR